MRRSILVAAALVAFLALVGAGCGAGRGAGEQDEPARRVLFVGNSLTATNDLPKAVSELAGHAGLGRLEAEAVAPGGVSLEEHWSQTGARERLEEGRWDVVVLQQGPSSLPESRAHLRRFAVRWAELARSLGVEPALLTVWPETARAEAFPAVVASYAAAAEAAGAVLLPAGEAWRRALERDPDLGLYAPDGLHPSELGTALAALVVALGVTETPPASLPSSVHFPVLDDEAPETARLLRESAAGALREAAGS